MTREETQALMRVVRVSYPAFYKGADRATLIEALDIWAICLSDLDYKLMQAALAQHIKTNKFAPTIAELREIAESKQQQEAFFKRMRARSARLEGHRRALSCKAERTK